MNRLYGTDTIALQSIDIFVLSILPSILRRACDIGTSSKSFYIVFFWSNELWRLEHVSQYFITLTEQANTFQNSIMHCIITGRKIKRFICRHRASFLL